MKYTLYDMAATLRDENGKWKMENHAHIQLKSQLYKKQRVLRFSMSGFLNEHEKHEKHVS